jgi:hypothetical protein
MSAPVCQQAGLVVASCSIRSSLIICAVEYQYAAEACGALTRCGQQCTQSLLHHTHNIIRTTYTALASSMMLFSMFSNSHCFSCAQMQRIGSTHVIPSVARNRCTSQYKLHNSYIAHTLYLTLNRSTRMLFQSQHCATSCTRSLCAVLMVRQQQELCLLHHYHYVRVEYWAMKST